MFLEDLEARRRRGEDIRVALAGPVLDHGVESVISIVSPDLDVETIRVDQIEEIDASTAIDEVIAKEMSGEATEWVSATPTTQDELEGVAKLIEKLAKGTTGLPTDGDWQ